MSSLSNGFVFRAAPNEGEQERGRGEGGEVKKHPKKAGFSHHYEEG